MITLKLSGRVRVALSDKADGNMRAVKKEDLAYTEENRRKLLAHIGAGFSSAYLVRVSYDTDDYCQFYEAARKTPCG
jgi:hypothetical protein